MTEPPSVSATVQSLALGVAAVVACLVVRAALDWHRTATRAHPAGCICPWHRRRDPKVGAAGKKWRSVHGA